MSLALRWQPRGLDRIRHEVAEALEAKRLAERCRQNDDMLPQQARDSFERFKRGNDQFVSYPTKYPAPPSRLKDAWAFATLGEVLRASPSGAVADLFFDILRLRNAIAHGHYVGWAHIKHAWQQLRRFDRR